MTLLKTGQTDGKTLSKHSKVPRQAVYRVLQELQHMGCVEKVLAAPSEFKPVPICDFLSTLIAKRAEDAQALMEKLEELRHQIETKPEEVPSEEPKFTIVQGKERIAQLMQKQHDKAQKSVDIISTGQRWLQILHYCLPNYNSALERGVKYRAIIDMPENKENLLKQVQSLLANPNFKIRLSSSIKTNAAVFDGKEATFNFYPAKLLDESPIILTNHVSFIAMCQSHFEALWKSAKKIKSNKQQYTDKRLAIDDNE